MKNIVLIGMPGCGKSTVGVILAKTLGAEFIDTDLVIQRREGALLQQLISSRGLSAFLDAEEAAVRSVHAAGAVIATGGSVVYREGAMEHLGREGVFVYLSLSYEEMMARLQNIKTCGIALPSGATMADLYAERIPLYEKYAGLTIPCTGKTVEETVEEIVAGLKGLEGV